MSTITTYNRINQLIHHVCHSNVSVGDALKQQQQEQNETPAAHNSIDLHNKQSTVSLPSLIFSDAVFILNSKKTISVGEWKQKIGQVVGTSDYITIEQARIDAFAVVTGDPQWIHTSAAKSLGM